MEQRESDIQHQIMAYLAAIGVKAWRNNVGRRGGVSFGLAGLPDIIGYYKGGRFLGIEVKAAGGKVTPEQMDFINAAHEAGAIAIVARSVDDVMAALDYADKGVL